MPTKLAKIRQRYRRTGEAAAEQATSIDPDDQTEVEPTGTPGAAAFFDIDNTVMHGSSMFHFARGAASHGLIDGGDIARFAIAQLRFSLLGGENMDEMAEAVEAGLSFVKGRSISEIVGLGEEVFDDTISDKMWTGTISLAQKHLDAGEPVWLVSATPVEIGKILAERLGFTGALGTVAETVDGHYTGHLVGYPLHGQSKAEAVRALARRENYILSECWAYSDSANDLPMLTTVGHPVAVNPDSDLKEQARDNSWPIYNFRGKRTAKRAGVSAAVFAGLVAAGTAAGVAAGRRR